MLLDLDDVRIISRFTYIRGDRIRLTIEYPRTTEYRDRIMDALADILRPRCQEQTNNPKSNVHDAPGLNDIGGKS